jgi:hypothetical protein
MANSSTKGDQEWEGFDVTSVRNGKTIFSISPKKEAIVSGEAKNEDKSTSKDWIFSGTNDAFLKELRELAEKSTVIMPGIRFNAAMRYGGGVEYGEIKIQDGEKVFVPLVNDEIEKFLEQNKIHEQLMTSFLDLEGFAFSVAQYGMNVAGDKIVRMNHTFTRASWCRFGERDKQGNIKKVMVSPDYGTSDFREDKMLKLDCLPEYIDDLTVSEWKKAKKKQFVSIQRIPDLGKSYYPNVDWYTSVTSGWYDIAQYIAEAKKFMFKNQFAIKYHIKIHPEYWRSIFGAEVWSRFTPEEKTAKKKEELDRIVGFAQGTENYGSTFFSELYSHRSEEFQDLIKFEELKNDFSASGEFMKESNESSDHMLSSLLIHPDIIGNAPGSSLGSGSGSGNRVAYNQRVAQSLFNQQVALDALRIVSHFNGWKVKWMMRNSLITTLDTGAAATKPNTSIPTATATE